jgi:hypothetical protein
MIHDYNPKGGTDPADLSRPVDLLRRNKAEFTRVYGKFGEEVKLLRGTPIKKLEYILVDDESTLRFLKQGHSYRLMVITNELIDPVVTVKRYRFCGGKALVLLESDNPLDSLYNLLFKTEIPVKSEKGEDVLGHIRPGGKGENGEGQDGFSNSSGKGQDGFSNSSGKGQGFPNAIGVTFHDFRQDDSQGGLSRDALLTGDPYLKIAVLDSGVRLQDGESFCMNTDTCRDAELGWDFVGNDDDPNDEQTNLHGTRVASIIHELCPEARLLPVRISNEQNVCTLYDVLCGLEYAGNQKGVRLINASWIFPTNRGVYIPLLQASLRRLAYKGILVVCSAGNVGREGAADLNDLNVIPHIGQTGKDKDDKPWYVPMRWPACSCQDLTNVISVTSIVMAPARYLPKRDDPARPYENPLPTGEIPLVCEVRSNDYVSVGVVVNKPEGGEVLPFGAFRIPGFNPFRGTSFAAPYVTGKIAKAIVARKDLSSRADVLKAIGVQQNEYLEDHINGGCWVSAD